MSPSKKDVVAKSSEYNAQYKGWKSVPSLKELKEEELKEATTNQRQSRSKQKQKQKVRFNKNYGGACAIASCVCLCSMKPLV